MVRATSNQVVNHVKPTGVPPDAIARAILFAVSQPDEVDVSELIVRPTASPY